LRIILVSFIWRDFLIRSARLVLIANLTSQPTYLKYKYSASALASALREREDTLQHCATLLATNQLDELSKILGSYDQQHTIQRRRNKEKILDFTQGGFDKQDIELLRRGLNRMPRRVSTAHSKRAGVVLPLCNVDGIPCILFEKRSPRLRAHPDEVRFSTLLHVLFSNVNCPHYAVSALKKVCLPGGMVSEGGDRSIVQTCLREMEEEIGIGHNAATVLGVLRCNWGEVHHLVGVAVTPVVCFLGEIGESELNPNPNEVAEIFSVPLELFLDRDRYVHFSASMYSMDCCFVCALTALLRRRWVHKKHYAPMFAGGPHIIWGLTAYIVNRFVVDIIERYDVVF
jgi:8-oxo-dGTP pyrophosphatase MutT (NUDIX family)